jgi:hypothetical protein
LVVHGLIGRVHKSVVSQARPEQQREQPPLQGIHFLFVPWFFSVSGDFPFLAIVSQYFWAGGEHPRNRVLLKNGSTGGSHFRKARTNS